MNGIVKGISRNKHRIAVLTDYGYTVFDIEEGEASMGDVISGNLGAHGAQDLTNQTTGQRLCVYIEAIEATLISAQSLIAHK